jgi:hypothetical protein
MPGGHVKLARALIAAAVYYGEMEVGIVRSFTAVTVLEFEDHPKDVA